MGILADEIDSTLGIERKSLSQEIDETLGLKPLSFTDKIGFAVETGLAIPSSIINSVARTIRGTDKDIEDSVLDKVINFTDDYNKKYTDWYSKNAETNMSLGDPTGLTPFSFDLPGIKIKDVQGITTNIGSTVTTLLAGIAGAVAGSVAGIPGGPVGMAIGASTGAATASGATAYRMAKDQFVDNMKDYFNDESLKNNGRTLSQDEWDTIRNKYESASTKYGLWEALPEALSSAVTLGVGKLALNTMKSALKSPLMKLAKTVGGAIGGVGTEIGTEAITEYGQSGVEKEVFGTEQKTPMESLEAVAKPTFLMSIAGLPIGLGGGMIQNKIQGIIDKKTGLKNFDDIVPVTEGIPDLTVLMTWANENPDKAEALISKGKPSRGEIDDAFSGKYRTTAEERNYIADTLKYFKEQKLKQEEAVSAEGTTQEASQVSEQATPEQGTEAEVRVLDAEKDRKTEEFYIAKIENGEELSPTDIEEIGTLPSAVSSNIIELQQRYDDSVKYLEPLLLRGDALDMDDEMIFNSLPQAFQDKLISITNYANENPEQAEVIADERIAEQQQELKEEYVEQPTVKEDIIASTEDVITQPEQQVQEEEVVEKPAPKTFEESKKIIADGIKNDKEFIETVNILGDDFTFSMQVKEGNEKGFDYKIGKKKIKDKTTFIKETKRLLSLNKESVKAYKNRDTETIKKIREQKAKLRNKFLASFGRPSEATIERRSTEQKPFKLYEAVIEAVKKYGGKFGNAGEKILKGASGLISARTLNIYVRSINDVLTSAHELAHYFDDTEKIFKDVYDYETRTFIKKRNIFDTDSPYGRLMRLYEEEYSGFSDPKRKSHDQKLKLKEGFATLLERMIAEPKRMKKEYPDLIDWLERKNIPIINDYLKDFSSIIEQYQSLSPIEKVNAKMVTKIQRTATNKYLTWLVDAGMLSKENAQKIQALGAKGGIRQALFNAMARVEDMEREVLGTQTLTNTMHAFRYVNGIISGNVYQKGMYQILKGDGYYKVLDFSIKDLFESVENTSKDNKLNMDKFSNLLIQRRVYGDWDRIDKLEAQLQEMVDDYGFQDINDLINNKDSLKKEELEILTKYNKMRSIVKEDGFSRAEATVSFEQYAPIYKKELEMYDAIMKARLDTLREVGRISKEQYDEYKADKFYTSFQRYFFQDHVDNLMRESVTALQTNVGSLKERKGNYNPIYAPLEGMIDSEISYQKDCMRQLIYNQFEPIFYRLGFEKFEGKKEFNDPEYIVTMKNGKYTSWRIGSDLRLMIHSIVHPAQPGLIARIFATASRIKTVGTTAAYIPFAFVNPLIDQATSYINSQNDMIPFFDTAKTINALYIEKNPEYLQFANEYDRIAHNSQTIYGLYERDPEIRRNLILNEAKGAKKYLDTMLEVGNRGLDILQWPVQFTETITRKTEYIKARVKGKRIFDALEEAGSVSTPFHHTGGSNTVKTIVRSMPFFNASLQVLDMTNKAFFGKNPKTRKKAILAMSFLTSTMVLGVASVMGFGSDESKKLLLQKTPNELARHIYLPWPWGGKLLEVRVPENMTLIATMLNMGMLEAFGNAKYKGSELVNGAMAWAPDQLNPFEVTQMVASWIPQLLKPIIEVIMDKKTYPNVQPLTPYSQQSLPKWMQKTETTSWFAKKIGTNILSPIQIDHLIEGYVGRASRFVTGRWDLVWKNPYVANWAYFTSGRMIQNYFSTYNKAKAEINAVKNGDIKIKDLDKDYLKRVYMIKNVGDSINNLMKVYRTIDKEKINDKKSVDFRNNILDLIDKFNEV